MFEKESPILSQPRFIDLFAGLGGFRLGLEQNGFTCVFGSDSNKNAATVYAANFGDEIHSDITELVPEQIPDFDVLCGGFPCQPFSSAGRKLGFEDTRGTLFFDICRILESKKPQVVFLENVKNLTTHDSGNTLKVIIGSLEKLGYTVSYQLMNALDFGVPQNRERILIVGNLGDKKFDFSKVKTQNRVALREFLEPVENEYVWLLEDEYVLLEEEQIKIQPKTGLKFVGYRKGNLRNVGTRENTEHLSRSHKQPNRIYSADGSHPTLSSQESSGRYYIYTHKPDGTMGVRKLTITECYRIFGYSEDYKRVGSLSEQYNRIGNSICVPMVASVAKEIQEQLFT